MSFFSTGSSQQLKNLKAEPFNFKQQDEVTQLQHNLLIRLPLLTILDENLGTWLLSGSSATAEHEEDANTWVKQRGKKTSDY
jgi:hypothetical protein